MTLPGKWNIEDLFVLTENRGLNASLIKTIVDDYHSFDDYKAANKPEQRQDIFNRQVLFDTDHEELKKRTEDQLSICEKNGYKIVTIWDELYPGLLKEIIHPPVMLFVWGELRGSDSVSISIVGTRKCTNYGKLTAERFASFISTKGIIITSGLAFGIDIAAHAATIRAGGITYAVIASGLDKISPHLSLKNAEKIVESGGAIISEYKCGTNANPGYFPQRNRIISGISKATLVVESGSKGGALITAKFAFDQSRDVFAVPGNISSEKSIGTNELIKRNFAQLAISPESMLEELGLSSADNDGNGQEPIRFLNTQDEKIYNTLNLEPMQIDEIAEKAGLDVSELLVRLLDMEFNGIVRQLPGKHYIRTT